MKTHDLKMEERLRAIVNNLPGMAYRCLNNKEWTMSFVSDGSIALSGYSPADLEDNAVISFADIIHPDDRERVWDTVQESIDTETPFQMSYRILTKEGVTKWVWEQGRFVEDTVDGLVLEGYITDITRQKGAEHALRDSEQRLQGVLRVAVNAIISLNEELVIESVNPAAETIFGYSGEEMVGQPVTNLLVAPDLRKSGDSVVGYIKSGKTENIGINGEVIGLRNGGEAFHIELSVGEVKLREGRMFAVLIRDITDQLDADRTLRLNEERYRSLTEASSAMVWRTGPEGGFESPQDQWAKYTGQSWEQHRGLGWVDALHPDDKDWVLQQLAKALDKQEPCLLTGRLWCAEAEEYFFSESRAVPIFKSDKTTVREWIGTTTDVHERKLAENKLKESEERFALAFTASNDCLWDMDLIDRKVVWNDAFKDQFADGVDPNLTDPLDWWKGRVHPADQDRILEGFRVAAKTKEPRWQGEYKFRKADGDYANVIARCVLDRGPSGKTVRVVGTLEDISKRRRLEEAVLSISEKVQRKIGRDIHDDLCQQLFGIQCRAQILEDELEENGHSEEAKLVEDLVKMLGDANDNARRTAYGLAPVALESEGLAGILEELARWVESAHGIRCEFKYGKPGPKCGRNAMIQIYRIAQEALVNAVKHGKSKNVFVTLFEIKDAWQLTIEDDGIGFPEQVESHGIGLPSMEFRARSIGAAFDIRNRRTKGTRVTCVFSPVPEETTKEK